MLIEVPEYTVHHDLLRIYKAMQVPVRVHADPCPHANLHKSTKEVLQKVSFENPPKNVSSTESDFQICTHFTKWNRRKIKSEKREVLFNLKVMIWIDYDTGLIQSLTKSCLISLSLSLSLSIPLYLFIHLYIYLSHFIFTTANTHNSSRLWQ